MKNNKFENFNLFFKIPFFSLIIILIIGFLKIDQIKYHSRNLLRNTKIFLLTKKNSSCNIKKIEYIPPESIVVIGHAYGSPSKKEDFISKKVQFFLKKNNQNIKTIVFTGDVFKIPSAQKWNKLNKIFGEKSNIIIAPGNHDTGLNTSFRTYFNNSSLSNKFPYKVKFKNFVMVVDDSTSNNWLFDKELYELINQIDASKTIILVRHHVPIRDLLFLANSTEGYNGGLPNFRDLQNSINRQKDTIIISGDGGAVSYLPRFICLKKKKLKVILNGIGDVSEDSIVVISKSEIYKFNLKKVF